MSRSSDDLAGIVIAHLCDILSGRCAITREQIERQIEEDRNLGEILTGLFYLNEDLVYREAERAASEEELKAAVRKLEAQNRELQQRGAAIAELAALAAELSSPVIQVWKAVLMVPIIGNMDAARAAGLTDRLLAAVVAQQARHVILDMTGVLDVETATVEHFLRILHSVRLLGADGIVAGIPPSMAETISSLGTDLSAFRTVRSVQEALRHCMRSS
jgi:rsbT co-antagonist protein RsbR